jgi:hypothetical protein
MFRFVNFSPGSVTPGAVDSYQTASSKDGRAPAGKLYDGCLAVISPSRGGPLESETRFASARLLAARHPSTRADPSP